MLAKTDSENAIVRDVRSFVIPSDLSREVPVFDVRFVETVDSTNELAKHLIQQKQVAGPTVVVTHLQTAGRGQGQKTWWSGPGCLTISFIVPGNARRTPQQLAMIAGVAVRTAACRVSGSSEIGLKWPNDVIFGRKKLAGILCQRLERFDLIGVGLNVCPEPTQVPAMLRETTTALSWIARKSIGVTEAAIELARQFDADFIAEPCTFAQTAEAYAACHIPTGRNVRLTDPSTGLALQGTCVGVDASGRLLLRDAEGKTSAIVSGSIRLVNDDPDLSH
jgi:BirA family biotin operon repressor/biotin-[acetyl-CoA-carboxylase] ligase